MNNLLFTALIIALLYYFFYYLPQQKKLNANLPLQHHQSTQTETIIQNEEPGAIKCPGPQFVSESETKLREEKETLLKDIQQKERTIIGLNNSYNKLETKKNKEITDLQEKIKTITHQLTELQTHQTKDEKDLESTLDNLLKNIQEMNNYLD